MDNLSKDLLLGLENPLSDISALIKKDILQEDDKLLLQSEETTDCNNSDEHILATIKNFDILIHVQNKIFADQPDELDLSVNYTKTLTQIFKLLRNIATKGCVFQNKITENNEFYKFISYTHKVYGPNDKSLSKMMFQCIANLGVKNKKSQENIWNNLNSLILDNLKEESGNCDICTMICYNMFLERSQVVSEWDEVIFKAIIKFKRDDCGFVALLVEHFLVKYAEFERVYQKLDDEERLETIRYAIDLVRMDDRQRRINSDLLKELISDFKKKSDLILKTETSYLNAVQPEEIVALLELIAIASNQTAYLWIFSYDNSLFLNVGCLLVSINKLGKASSNMFTPLNKLEQVAPNSADREDVEDIISYQFKSQLVRIIANLSYKNKKMQDLSREMDILLAVLECTNPDGRNPLIKEWSILAIRNLCENNKENQDLIGSLNKIGDAENTLLTDNREQNGSIRVTKPS